MINLATAKRVYTHYKKTTIPKRDGRPRIIHAPDDELKSKQRQLLQHLYRTEEGPGPYAFAYVRGKGIKEHASAHVGRKYVVRMDIDSFFDRVTPEHLEKTWEFDGFTNEEIAGRFADIPEAAKMENIPAPLGLVYFSFIPSRFDLFKLGLPQGSPLSGALSNLAMKPIDFRIVSMLRKWGPPDARYTRYADDIIISSDEARIIPLAKPIRKILLKNGFKENRKKFRVMRQSGRQIVCGIIVNNKKLALPKDKRREYRGRLHRLFLMAIHGEKVDGSDVNWDEFKKELAHLEGYLSFAQHVSPEYYEKYKTKLATVKAIFAAKAAAPKKVV